MNLLLKLINEKIIYEQSHYYLSGFKTHGDFCLVAISIEELDFLTPNEEFISSSKDFDTLISNKEAIHSILYIKKSIQLKVLKEIELIFEKIKYNSHFMFLLEYKSPPVVGLDIEPNIENFICSKDIFDRLKADEFNKACYVLSSGILNNTIQVNNIFILQLGKKTSLQLPYKEKTQTLVNDVSFMLPHCGDTNYLKTCLGYISKQTLQISDVNICFDDESYKKLNGDLGMTGKLNLWRNSPSNVGPYYPRDYIFKIITSDNVIFHDSDDISTSNRVEVLLNEFREHSDIGMLGSHFLDVDEMEETIYAFRYPLNVNNAFKKFPKSYVLHPTTLVNKRAYLSAGGFTRWRKFASDAQFNLKAPFFMKVRNSDNFLYIKRTRKESLLTSSKTHMNSRIRKFFHRVWQRDLKLIGEGKLEISASSLYENELEPMNDFKLIKIN